MDRPSRLTPLATMGLAVLVVLAFVSVAMHGRSSPPSAGRYNDFIGRPAFDFTLPDLAGQPTSLSALKGQVVVLDFWATWCPTCIEEMPLTTAIAARYADRGVTYKAVNVGDPPDFVREFVKQKQITADVLLDATTHVGEVYDAQYLPLIVVIDRDGRIVAHGNMMPDEVEKTLPAWIESALKSGQAS